MAVLLGLTVLQQYMTSFLENLPFFSVRSYGCSPLQLYELLLWTEHPDVAMCLNNLALHREDLGKIVKAEPLDQRAFAIYQQLFGNEHPLTKTVEENYIRVTKLIHREQGRKDWF